jgi:hypothetical protein
MKIQRVCSKDMQLAKPHGRGPLLASTRAVIGGIDPVTSTPAEFDAHLRSEARRGTKVFRDSGIGSFEFVPPTGGR